MSDAIKTIISFYEERERTRAFFRMLVRRSEEARRHPEGLVLLEEFRMFKLMFKHKMVVRSAHRHEGC